MKDTCGRNLPTRTSGLTSSLAHSPLSFRVRVLRSNSKLPSTRLQDLPNELLLYLLKFLPLSDLQCVYRVNKQFKWLLDSTPRIWAGASVTGRWPTDPTELDCFKRVADLGNLEATIKLGVAYLYSEGVEPVLCKDGKQAAKYFACAEKLAATSSSFTWLFIRPPWSNSGTCCKARVFRCMEKLCTEAKEADKSVLFSLAKLHSFIEEMDTSHRSREGCKSSTSRHWLQRAEASGCEAARYELWKDSLVDSTNDTASNLNMLRQLREFASRGCVEAKLRLYSEYAKGKLGGVSKLHSQHAIRGFVRDSRPTKVHTLLRAQNGLNSAMRYILVDWLVEVGNMKDYSCLTIHSAVQLVDRYLMTRHVNRATLQLVGITCMVICSRLLEDDIITIREAAWLTDGTYKYEDVVRMLGDVVATLKGNLKDLTILDYLHLFCQVVAADKKMEYLALYISELSLLHADFGQYPQAHVAACCLLLARLLLGTDFPWPSHMVEHTGLELKDLVQCTLHLHNKCFLDDPVKDHREVTLAAVKQRFSEDLFLGVGRLEILDHAALRSMLPAEEVVEEEDDEEVDEGDASGKMVDPLPSSKDGLDAFLLMSPSRKARGKSRHRRTSGEYMHDDRSDRVSTPTHEFPEEEELDIGADIKPIDKDICESDTDTENFENEHQSPGAKYLKGEGTISSRPWVVLDESSSLTVNTRRTASPSMPSSASSSSLLPKDVPCTSSCFVPHPSLLSSSSSSASSSSLTPNSAKNQVTYTISANGRLCQQRVKTRKVSSPIGGRCRGVAVSAVGGVSPGISDHHHQSQRGAAPSPTRARYQFRQRTPVQSFKRKTMEDSSEEGPSGH